MLFTDHASDEGNAIGRSRLPDSDRFYSCFSTNCRLTLIFARAGVITIARRGLKFEATGLVFKVKRQR